MKRDSVWLSLSAVLLLGASYARWHMEAFPTKKWGNRASSFAKHEYCPDGMDQQIDLFAQVLRGREGAWPAYRHYLKNSHQSSTYLVSVLGGPLVLLGFESAHAFVLISAAAGMGTLWLLIGLLQRCIPDDRRLRAMGLAFFLCHPATLRCFCRPQTDSLTAFFWLASVVAVWRLVERSSRGSGWWAMVCMSAATLVKIHTLSLLLLAAATAWLAGARGSVLRRTLVVSVVLPLGFWLLVFAGLDLFGTIGIAWEYKSAHPFYAGMTAPVVVATLLVTLIPLSLPALAGLRRSGIGLPLGLAVAGFAAILGISLIPPIMRFQYPMLAPLCLLAALGLKRCPRLRVGGWLWVGWLCLLSVSLLGILLYRRELGPTRDWQPLDALLIHLM